jgi:HD-GYP domain-containing protein (c-di-GMP phosphodiesterase class II)
MSARSALVVDPDPVFLKTLSAQAGQQAGGLGLLTAQDGKAANAIISDPSRRLAAIFINPAISQPSGLMVIRLAHQYRPGVPIHIVSEAGESHFSEQDQRLLAVHRVVEKPVSYAELLKLANPTHMQQGEDASAAETPKQEETSEDDKNYFPVRANDFLSAERSFFNLFIRLASGHYVKVLNAGDEFTQDQLRGYLRKGLTLFYIRREEQEGYLNYCDRLAQGTLRNPSASLESKVGQMVLHGEETMRFLRNHGFKESQLEHASHFIGQINDLLRQVDFKKYKVFKAFMANLNAVEHGTGTAIVASLVASSMKVVPPAQTLGVAALFHDLGLYQMPVELQEEDESSFTPAQWDLYRTHPSIGAQLLSSIDRFDPASAQAVALHHQRLQGRGFPALGDGRKPDTLAELVGISDEFVRLVLKTKHAPTIQPLKEMEKGIFDGFSRPVVEAFRNFFFLTLL